MRDERKQIEGIVKGVKISRVIQVVLSIIISCKVFTLQVMDGTTHAYTRLMWQLRAEHIQCPYDNSGENSRTDNHFIEKMARSSFKTVYILLLLTKTSKIQFPHTELVDTFAKKGSRQEQPHTQTTF